MIFHVFSNGGANIYSKLIKEIYQYNSVFNYQPIHVAGVIFDSCPGRPRPFTGMKAALVSTGHYWTARTSDFSFVSLSILYQVFLVIDSIRTKISCLFYLVVCFDSNDIIEKIWKILV